MQIIQNLYILIIITLPVNLKRINLNQIIIKTLKKHRYQRTFIYIYFFRMYKRVDTAPRGLAIPAHTRGGRLSVDIGRVQSQVWYKRRVDRMSSKRRNLIEKERIMERDGV